MQLDKLLRFAQVGAVGAPIILGAAMLVSLATGAKESFAPKEALLYAIVAGAFVAIALSLKWAEHISEKVKATIATVVILGFVAVLGFAAYVLVQSMTEPSGPCTDDGECRNGTACVDGACVRVECTSDDECDDGACVGGQCVPATGCRTADDCDAGTCIEGACTVAFHPDLWARGSRWVFRKALEHEQLAYLDYSYRIAREVVNVVDAGDATRIDIAEIGGHIDDRVLSYVATDRCLYDFKGEGERELRWCLPESPDAWRTINHLGHQTRVAEFTATNGFTVVFSPDLGWVEFHKDYSDEPRSYAYYTEEYRVGDVGTDDADDTPITCDWDSHDDADDRETVELPATPAPGGFEAFVADHAADGAQLYAFAVDGPHEGDFREGAVITDGETTFVRHGDTDLALLGEACDVGYWRNPEDGGEHVIVMTREACGRAVVGGPTWGMHHIGPAGVRSYAFDVRPDKLDPDPFPNMQECTLRVVAKDTPSRGWSQLAEFQLRSDDRFHFSAGEVGVRVVP